MWECLQIPMCLHIITRISYTSTSFCHIWKLHFRFQEVGSFSSQFPLNRGEILKKQNVFSAVLLLLLSCFSRVRLCATPETAAHQAHPSLGFSRQEHWSGLPFPSPMHESEKSKWSHSVVSDPQRPHGLQPTRLLCPWARQEYWSGVPSPSQQFWHLQKMFQFFHYKIKCNVLWKFQEKRKYKWPIKPTLRDIFYAYLHVPSKNKSHQQSFITFSPIRTIFHYNFPICCCWVTSVVSDSVRPHRRQPTRTPAPPTLSLGFSRQEH